MNLPLLLICRALGILDIALSAITLTILSLCLNGMSYKVVPNGFILMYHGDHVGDIQFKTDFNETESQHCGCAVMERSAKYIKDHFDEHIFLAIAAMLGFLLIAVYICIFTVTKHRFALKMVIISEVAISIMVLIICIIFYSETFCVFEYAKAPHSTENLKIQSILIIAVPSIILVYKGFEILLLFFLDRFIIGVVPEVRELTLLEIAMARARKPNTEGVYVSEATQKNIIIVKSKHSMKDARASVLKDEMNNDMRPKVARTGAKEVMDNDMKPKVAKSGKRIFRKELLKEGRDNHLVADFSASAL